MPDTGSRGQRKFDRGLTSPGSIEVVQLPTGQAGVVKTFAEAVIPCDAVLFDVTHSTQAALAHPGICFLIRREFR